MSAGEDPLHGLVVRGEVCQQMRTPTTDWMYGVKYVNVPITIHNLYMEDDRKQITQVMESRRVHMSKTVYF